MVEVMNGQSVESTSIKPRDLDASDPLHHLRNEFNFPQRTLRS